MSEALDALRSCKPWGHDCGPGDGRCCAAHRQRKAERERALDACRRALGQQLVSVTALERRGMREEAAVLALWWTRWEQSR